MRAEDAGDCKHLKRAPGCKFLSSKPSKARYTFRIGARNLRYRDRKPAAAELKCFMMSPNDSVTVPLSAARSASGYTSYTGAHN